MKINTKYIWYLSGVIGLFTTVLSLVNYGFSSIIVYFNLCSACLSFTAGYLTINQEKK